jgi:ribosomal protein S18 acetylase RimI-like enzyme
VSAYLQLAVAVEIVRRAYDSPDARALTAALFAEQESLYGRADPPDGDPRAFEPPSGTFLVAYAGDGEAVACGGWRTYDRRHRTAEILKLYVHPKWRRRGLGEQIMHRLERAAAEAGAVQVILETGIRSTAAVNLYQSRGYQRIDSYVVTRDPATNRAFAKSLRRTAH